MDNTALSLDDFPSMESEPFKIPSMNNTLLSQDDFSSMKSKSNKTPSMDNKLLSQDDFRSMESKSNMTPPVDSLRSGLKSNYGEEDNLTKKEERVTQKKRSIVPRKVTKQLMIRNNSEDQQHTSDNDRGNRKRSCDNQEQKKKKKRKRSIPVRDQVPELDNEFKNNSEDQQHTSDNDRGNRKRWRDNQEQKKKKKSKRNIPVRDQVPELDNEFKNNSEDQQHTSDNDRGKRKRWHGNQEQKKKKKKKRKRNSPVRDQVPELDNEFKNLITSKGGSLESLKLVIQKKLFETDVSREEARLSIPGKKIINHFLEQEEDEHLNKRNNEDKMNEKRVMLIEPSRKVSKIKLRKWFMKKANGKESWSYVLVTGWNKVAKRNALEAGTKVQLWAFRKGTHLGFALVKL